MAARSANAMQMPNLRMPTGYESEQRKIEAKRRIAQAMLAQGIAPDRISNWTQVLAKLAQTWVGKSEDKKATRMEGEMYDRMQGDLQTNLGELRRMQAAGATNQDIVNRFQGNTMMENYLKPYEDAIASGLKNQEDLVDSGGPLGYVRKGDYVGKPMPMDPNKPVYVDDNGNIAVNPVRATASQAAQGLVNQVPGQPAGTITPVYSMSWPGAKGAAPAQSDYSPTPQPKIPPGAMKMLIDDPSLAQQFDEKYGPGSAEEVIRSTGRPYEIYEGRP